ncbi:amidohydrolase family protein [Euzebya pacifica]|uniref:amidohydrolase family protein n=1 Tax=Euzebya pacifica TaxID=1608957 RepID=UPI0030F59267
MSGWIDVSANLFTPEVLATRPEWTKAFHRKKNGLPEDLVQGTPVDRHLAMMDAAGIQRTLLIAAKIGRRGLPGSWELDPMGVRAVCEQHPDRFSALYGVNPYDSIAGIKELERLVTDHGFVGAHLYPHWFEMAPDHPMYYPFYGKCAELGIPIQIQVGYCRVYAPEQPLPSVGRPSTIDRIATHLPELKILAIHVGWPWTEEMISVADKHRNVYIGTDRHPPSKWGDKLVHYINSWGQDKVLFGTDFPVVPYDVVTAELADLDLKPEARDRLMGANAAALYDL